MNDIQNQKKKYLKKPFDPEKSGGGGHILKSGCAKKYTFQKFRGGGGGKGDLEISRFDWVFLNDGLPKGKGGKSNLDNDRGIFLVTIFRSILMRLIYMDKYEEIDKSMSDSQIGGRKGKNVRDHIWIINGIITEVLSKKSNIPVDLLIYDYKQCFDTLWLQECMNEMYNAGLDDDKFNILYNANSDVDVTVKTPVGKTEPGKIKDVVLQGDVFAPLLCSKFVDTIGQECLTDHKYTYT